MTNYNDTPAYMGGASGGGGLDIPGWLNSLFGGKKNQDQGFAGTNNPAPAQYTTPSYMSGASGGSADIKAAPSGGGFDQGVSGTFDPNPASSLMPSASTAQAPQQQGNRMIDGILAAINNKDPYDSGPYMANLDQARSAQLAAIADAENRTNQNFDQSDQAIGNIYAKGKQDTLADNQTLKDNNANLVGGLNNMYSGAVQGLQDDRHKEMQDQTEMLKSLGIQQAGMGDAGQTQTKAIANASQNQQAAVDKAMQYGGADLTANTARADGLISEGSARQAALRSQLSGVLGQLDSKKLDINNQYEQNAMQARNQSYQDNLSKMSGLYGMYDKELTRADDRYKTDQNSRVQSALIAAQGRQAGSNNNMDDAANYVNSKGGNGTQYVSAYAKAVAGASTPAGMQPTDTDILRSMMQVDPKLDLNLALATIQNAKASSKYNSPNTMFSGMLGSTLQ
jgi:hypothetical protein